MGKEYKAILSEKPEDQKEAAEWAKDQIARRKRNKEIGDELRKRIMPMIEQVIATKRAAQS